MPGEDPQRRHGVPCLARAGDRAIQVVAERRPCIACIPLRTFISPIDCPFCNARGRRDRVPAAGSVALASRADCRYLRVRVKASAGLASQMAGVHQLPQQRTAAVLRVPEAFVEDVEGVHHGVEPDEVRRFQRPIRCPSSALKIVVISSAAATPSCSTNAACS